MDSVTLPILGTGSPALLLLTAVALGALHGLEPGHSKTMMASFIIAIRGTVMQAVLLGLAAMASHTAVVWGLALLALQAGGDWLTEEIAPYLLFASGLIVIGLGVWTIWRVNADAKAGGTAGHPDPHGHAHPHGHGHDHDHDHDHDHGRDDGRDHHHPDPDHLHGLALASGAAAGPAYAVASSHQPAVAFADAHARLHEHIHIHPHDHAASHRDHAHDLSHSGPHSPDHGPDHGADHGPDHTHPHRHVHDHHHHLDPADAAAVVRSADDSHALAHAEDIRRQFAGRDVTTGQIVLFGLTGGLLPCSGAVTILLICLQAGDTGLGFALVGGFSFGLAAVLVGVGVAAALGSGWLRGRFSRLDGVWRRLPYLSGAVVVAIGVLMLTQGVLALADVAALHDHPHGHGSHSHP